MEETHHEGKLDSPSGTALTIVDVVKAASGSDVGVKANREGDAPGLHVLVADSGADRITLSHESFSRRAFAEGAVRAAEWMAMKKGCYDFKDVYGSM